MSYNAAALLRPETMPWLQLWSPEGLALLEAAPISAWQGS